MASTGKILAVSAVVVGVVLAVILYPKAVKFLPYYSQLTQLRLSTADDAQPWATFIKPLETTPCEPMKFVFSVICETKINA
jgi:hypothetical protein